MLTPILVVSQTLIKLTVSRTTALSHISNNVMFKYRRDAGVCKESICAFQIRITVCLNLDLRKCTK